MARVTVEDCVDKIPNRFDLVLFAATRAVFRDYLGREPRIEVIPAGLECGLMQERLPEVEMVSFGPTIEGAHTPRERMEIATVAECWELLLRVLKNTPA